MPEIVYIPLLQEKTRSDKVWMMGLPILLCVVYVVVYFFQKQKPQHDVSYSSINLQTFKSTFCSRMLEKEKQASKNAKFQFQYLGQIDGQLYAPLNQVCRPSNTPTPYIELIGHQVSMFDSDKPHTTMMTHPQDSVLDIMQKFNISPRKVLVYKDIKLENLDMTLMEYGIPDNLKVNLMVKQKHDVFKDEEVTELFQNL